jgi:hypothetical protein
MNSASAIECHRQPLLNLVAALYAMIGLAGGGMAERLSRPLYRKVLSLLRPAEWSVRRLIVVAALGLTPEPLAARKAAKKSAGVVKTNTGNRSKRRRVFALFDPLARVHGFPFRRRPKHPKIGPRIRTFDTLRGVVVYVNGAPPAAPSPSPPPPDGTVNCKSLCRCLDALKRALEDLPGQARRYARWRAKAIADCHPRRDTVLRRLPPFNPRRKPRHEVHEILEECDWLARTVLKSDSS